MATSLEEGKLLYPGCAEGLGKYMYMYKQDLALNNLQGLICHKTQLTNFSSACIVIISITCTGLVEGRGGGVLVVQWLKRWTAES